MYTGAVDIPDSMFLSAFRATPFGNFTALRTYFFDNFLYSVKLFFTVIYESDVFTVVLGVITFALIISLFWYIVSEFFWFLSDEIAYYWEKRLVFLREVFFVKWARSALEYSRMTFHGLLGLFSSRVRDAKEDKKREENPTKAYAEGFRKAQDELRSKLHDG